MTISYSDQFLKLLLRWRGSLWKAIWKHLLLFLSLYYLINLIYRFLLSEGQQVKFMKYVILFDEFLHEIPLTFLLGFYVQMVVRRWWEQCQLISWPDELLFNVSALIRGKDAETTIIRKTIARYCTLTAVLAWRSISLRVLMRYPTDEHLLYSGLINKEELEMYQEIQVNIDPHKKWFVPLNWIQTMLVRCYEKGTLSHTNELRVLLDSLEKYRNGFFQLFIYDWITIPLVYTQVASISVYGYFAFALIGRQFPSKNENGDLIDLYVPIFTILQFLFYVGWLKVGEDLMFPFGADDEDFEFNYILDRNNEMSNLIVDKLHNQVPPVYIESLNDEVKLLHTVGSQSLNNHPPIQHLANTKFGKNHMSIFSDEPTQSKRNSSKHPKKTKESFKKIPSFSDMQRQAFASPDSTIPNV
uniref:Bestrophin homolog n=1 Tax=Strongyloides stercoralis TaxID=6248 RepID=A0A0K0E4U6_STRER